MELAHESRPIWRFLHCLNIGRLGLTATTALAGTSRSVDIPRTLPRQDA